jgi:hypothetical protein
VRRLREEVHDEAQNHEEYGHDVDRQAPFAQAPAAWQQWLTTETLENDAADRNNVGAEKCTSAERGDDVKRDCAAQVDEREKHAEDVGCNDGVERDVTARLDVGEGAGEGCSAVTSL